MEENKGNAGWAVLGFFLPIVGLILWLVWKNNKPADAKMAGKGALIGALVLLVVGVIATIVTSCALSSAANTQKEVFDSFNDMVQNSQNNFNNMQ